MAEEKKERSVKEQTSATKAKEGAAGSEHSLETSGMRHAPEDRERRREDRAHVEGDGDVHELRTTSRTEMDREAEKRGKGQLAARTPQEMSLHDELSREGKDAKNRENDESEREEG